MHIPKSCAEDIRGFIYTPGRQPRWPNTSLRGGIILPIVLRSGCQRLLKGLHRQTSAIDNTRFNPAHITPEIFSSTLDKLRSLPGCSPIMSIHFFLGAAAKVLIQQPSPFTSKQNLTPERTVHVTSCNPNSTEKTP